MPLPPWLKKRFSPSADANGVEAMLADLHLATVCTEAHCPNRHECYSHRTATFLILGDSCTRNCRFCAVAHNGPTPLRDDEPEAVAEACARLGLRHVVITSVTRDDLSDDGAGHFARTIAAVRARLPHASLEVLTPDFRGDKSAVEMVLAAHPDVFNHNLETVARLYSTVRPQASYAQSLEVLRFAKEWATQHAAAKSKRNADPYGERPEEPAKADTLCRSLTAAARHRTSHRIYTKSGIMVGLGETDDEVLGVLNDLRSVGCDIVTIGQYLSPSPQHIPVARYVAPAIFASWTQQARQMGFVSVASGPFVRSSYHAEEVFANREL